MPAASAISPPAEGVSVASAGTPRMLPFLLACGLFAGWFLMLSGIGWFTANPVLLNPRQLEQSPLVLVGEVSREQANKVKVVEVLDGELAASEITVENLPSELQSSDRLWLLPLQAVRATDSNRFRITDDDDPETAPLVYPDSPEVREQFRRWLAEP